MKKIIKKNHLVQVRVTDEMYIRLKAESRKRKISLSLLIIDRIENDFYNSDNDLRYNEDNMYRSFNRGIEFMQNKEGDSHDVFMDWIELAGKIGFDGENGFVIYVN